MVNLITEMAKYLIILLMALYTFNSFRVFARRSKEKQQKIYRSMEGLTYLIHALCYLQLFIGTMDVKIIILYLAELAVFILVSAFYKTGYKRMSMLIFRNMMMLLMVGFVILTRLSFGLGMKQLIYAAGALLICLVVPFLIERFQLWKHLGWFYVLVGLGSLAILLFIGSEKFGSKNWLFIGETSIQPSEFVKIIFIFGTAALLTKYKSLTQIIAISAIAAAHVIVLVLEKDLGGAMLYFMTYLIMLYGSTAKTLYLGLGFGGGAIAAVGAYYLFSHVQTRIAVFLDPFATYQNGGYQVAQSLFAVGTGGWFGMGLGKGLTSGIPVAESDFIFSAIAEEFGGIFAICLILICLSCFIMFINISVRLNNTFYKLVALGLGIMYAFQVFLNIGGVIKMIPLTGVTLPLVSAGGSSLISTILMFSIIQGMYVLRQRELAQGEAYEAEDYEEVIYEEDALGRRRKVVRKNGGEVKNDQSDRAILRLTYLFGLFLFATIGYLGYFLYAKSGTIINSPYNLRQDLLADRYIRGDILSSDGKVLATTERSADGKETRVYPYGKMFSHVVGRFAKGKTGIEMSENFTMLTCNVNGLSQILNEISEEKNYGDNVISTIDYNLQKTAYEALADYKGAVVVLEASTGKILAMVSKPDYNPNKVTEEWESLSSDTSGNSPLLNRATQGLYAPGSTFKVLTLLEFLRENPEQEKEYVYNCKGKAEFDGITINCAGNSVHGKQNLKQSFTNSCNTSFANIGTMLNQDSLKMFCESVGFNAPLKSNFPASNSRYTAGTKEEGFDVPRTSIGLGKTLVTPLHNAMIASAVANKGVVMKPYAVDSVVNHSGNTVRTIKPQESATWMSEAEANLLKEYMQSVVKKGTASALSGLSVPVAGKTGTATYNNDKKPHAWFIGFAPVKEPEIVISVLIESVGNGSSYAVPVAKKIIQAYYG